MKIILNGVERELATGTTVAALMMELDLAGGRIAVLRNGDVVTRATFDREVLAEGDIVEFVALVGGG